MITASPNLELESPNSNNFNVADVVAVVTPDEGAAVVFIDPSWDIGHAEADEKIAEEFVVTPVGA